MMRSSSALVATDSLRALVAGRYSQRRRTCVSPSGRGGRVQRGSDQTEGRKGGVRESR